MQKNRIVICKLLTKKHICTWEVWRIIKLKQSDYTSKLSINSTMLGTLLANLDENALGSISNIMQEHSVKDFLNDYELVKMVELFFINNLNIIQTSKMANIHRNTLVYRLDKINKLLGLDIRNFEDAVTLQIILVLKKLELKRRKRTTKRERDGLLKMSKLK
ncbi:MAG: helix-turn-helix domain-containing protein [Clostridia bacterium]|nr:helix-turn-helix domain-containing protein [Clostridia bacterium]